MYNRFLITSFVVSLIFSLVLGYKNQLITLWQQKLLWVEKSDQDDQIGSTQVLGLETSIDQHDFSTKLYNLLISYRKEQKLPPITVSKRLERSAQLKINDMVEKKYYQHSDQNDIESWYFFNQVGYYYTQAGENLAFAATSPWQVFTDWQNSPTHNQQLLDPKYQHMGLAVDCQTFAEYYRGGCLVVLHLGSLK